MTDDASIEAAVADVARLDAVRRTELLGTPAEDSFDRQTALARRLLGVPAAFLSLVDAHADFYKSQCGFDEPLASARYLHGRTFCHHVLVHGAPLLIEDTLADPRYRDVPTVASLGVRAYAGVPIADEAGHTLGSFCAVDVVPRAWSEADVAILVELARSAEREIRLRLALRSAQARLDSSREVARVLEQTLAVVAHDLRTPLDVLSLAVEVLDARYADAGPLVERMKRALDSSVHLVDDLLQRTRVGTELRREPIEVEQLLSGVTAMLLPLVQRHGVELVSDPAPAVGEVVVDYQLILRALSNLVINAVKFSERGTVVHLSAARAGGSVRLSVTDQGAGIPPEQLASLGQPFWQGDKRDTRGVGLGLSIVHAIAAAHGGTLDIATQVGRGTVFSLALPTA